MRKTESTIAQPPDPSVVRTGIPRPIEACIALLGLLAAAPLIGLAAAGVALSSRGPVLFRQVRVGRRGRPFTMYKLRTMRLAVSGPQVTAGDDRRITAVGKLLRKTKLDELPELWNILRGDMSLIGPRPEVPRYVDLQSGLWRLVLEARPGLTDPMTLRLRNEEELLAAVAGDREAFYCQTLLPFKLHGYLAYLRARSWRTDLVVLRDTALGVLFPGRAPLPTLDEIRTVSERGE